MPAIKRWKQWFCVSSSWCFFILFFMLTQNLNNRKYSEKALDCAMDYTSNIIEGAAELYAYHRMLSAAADKGKVPGDPALLQQVEQHFSMISLLVAQEQALLRHAAVMNGADEAFRTRYASMMEDLERRRQESVNVKEGEE